MDAGIMAVLIPAHDHMRPHLNSVVKKQKMDTCANQMLSERDKPITPCARLPLGYYIRETQRPVCRCNNLNNANGTYVMSVISYTSLPSPRIHCGRRLGR
jgi:hypothetical protein